MNTDQGHTGELRSVKEENKRLKERILELEVVLSFYANRENWKRSTTVEGCDMQVSLMMLDCDGDFVACSGLRARNALKAKEE